MKVKCELTLDTEKDEYEIQFWNLSSPGKPIEYTEIMPVLKKIFENNNEEIVDGIESDERVTKHIH